MAVISGGDKLAKALKSISNNLKRGGQVKVGFLSKSTYPDGTSVALIASINEFGAPSRGQPPRPFFRNMVAAKSAEWPAAIEQNLIATNYDSAATLKRVGEGVAGQLRQSIVDLTEPPLKPSTIKAKGHDKPLIDSGVMLASVDYEVETK